MVVHIEDKIDLRIKGRSSKLLTPSPTQVSRPNATAAAPSRYGFIVSRLIAQDNPLLSCPFGVSAAHAHLPPVAAAVLASSDKARLNGI